MTRRILQFSSPSGHYVNKYAFFWCSDRRFREVRHQLETTLGDKMADPIIRPGGIKVLVEPKDPRDRDCALEEIELLKTHGFTTLYAMAHNQCAACGGVGDRQYYEQMLQRAKRIIQARIPDLSVKLIFADFDGLYEVDWSE